MIGESPGRTVAAGPPAAAADGEEPFTPPRNRMAVALLSLVGFFVALYLLAHNLGLMGQIVCGVGSCETVQASRYAKVGPVPVSAIGVGGYLALLVLAIAGLQPRFARSLPIRVGLVGGALLGVAFSAYLTWLEAFVINAWCQWCVVSAIVITLILLATLPELRRPGGRGG